MYNCLIGNKYLNWLFDVSMIKRVPQLTCSRVTHGLSSALVLDQELLLCELQDPALCWLTGGWVCFVVICL